LLIVLVDAFVAQTRTASTLKGLEFAFMH
jgi:hypothetical protein